MILILSVNFDDINIDENIQIFFIDSQGIGDEDYLQNYSIVLDKLHSIFCSVSTICISIPDINETIDDLQNTIKIIRRTQLMSGSLTKTLLLVKGYEKFDRLEDFDFNSIHKFHKQFLDDYKNQYQMTSQYYINVYLIPLTLGNCKYNYENYIYSCWYSLFNFLSQVNEENLFTKDSLKLTLSSLISNLFGEDYKRIYTDIVENPPENSNEIVAYFANYNRDTAEIFKCCYSCCYFLANTISCCLESSLTINQNVDQLFLEITRIIFIVNDFILPFILGEYNISLSDFWQYSADLSADIHSFLKSNSKEWKKHMKLENDASKAKKPVIITTSLLSLFIPIISIPFFIGGVGGGFSLYRKIQKIRREKIKSSFSPTIYPFIWDKNLVNIKQCLYNMNRIKQIGWKNDILIIFYEQNGNDSSLLFRSLTGYNVDFTNQDRISQLFSNVSIKAFMERFKRYGKTHTSNLEKLRVNILYLKGYSQNDIRYICHAGHYYLIHFFISLGCVFLKKWK